MTTIDVSSPLYLHFSDRNNFMTIEKLQGSPNYRSWKRSMEIALSSKRKLGFVNGTLSRDATDAIKGEAWDTCNNMIISWILGSVSDSIKKSIMFVNGAKQIWQHLEQRFALTNGSRKYKLNKELYETKQQGKHVSEYYTQMRSLWEELESLNILPEITTVTADITKLITALEQQKEEQKLFQFLNGLDEIYGAQRSLILMMLTLPSVEVACSYLEQEEAQREVLGQTQEEPEGLAMFSKGNIGLSSNVQAVLFVQCGACGKNGHTSDKCWTVVGFPSWHAKAIPQTQSSYRGRGRGNSNRNQPRWNKGRQSGGPRVAANVQGKAHNDTRSVTSSTTTITSQQLEQLLRMLPTSSKGGGDTDDEIECNYAEILQKTELPLEEKFSLLGGIPWDRVLAAQKYIDCHENVLKWDDSAAKEALFDAHERLFSMINSLPCEHPLPDPDMYIDNIDWNVEIDPGLISDMEKENRNPDEAENSTCNKISGCNDKRKSTADNPLESPRVEDNVDVKDLAGSWIKCGDSLELKNAMNSLEQRGLIGDEAPKDIKPNESNNVLDVDSRKLRPGETPNCRKLTNCGNNSQNLKWLTGQKNDTEKTDSGMHSRACRKREEYQENTKRRKSQKHEGADSKSEQVSGKGRPQTRYNLRPRNC